MFSAEKGANSIAGNKGFMPNQDHDSDLLQQASNKNHIPNYAGFVPGIRAENLFGKTFGKITQLSSTHHHHQGSDLPKDLRYLSEVKEAYTDLRNQKVKDRLLYSKLDPQATKCQTYTQCDLSKQNVKKRVDDKERISTLSYMEAIKQV